MLSIVNRKLLLALLIGWVFLAVGCANTHQHYYWGEYSSIVLSRYVAPNKMLPERQVSLITRDIEKAENTQKPVAPGLYAHLGLAFAELGDMASAHLAFEEEMRLYPESRVLLEGMIAREKEARLKREALNE